MEMIPQPGPNKNSGHRSRSRLSVAAAGLIISIVVLLRVLHQDSRVSPDASGVMPAEKEVAPVAEAHAPPFTRLSHGRTAVEAALSAEQIVASKVIQFARSRREIAHAMARKFNFEVPADVDHFFDLAEAGRWEELDVLYKSMKERRESEEPGSLGLARVWPAMLETLGTTEVAREWPAQRLLDYGNTIIGSLRPDMIYVGGTDPGRFIPTLLNETGEGPRHIVLTQNALADNSYLDYVSFLYGDRLATPTKDDSDQAFKTYIEDAGKRLRHDQEFPDEPKQLRPGEDVRMIDNKLQVSGQVAVMDINERLFQSLMAKNPEASFALEESFPLKSLFAGATSLGPIMEVRVRDEQDALTAERAAKSVDYWRDTAQQLLGDPQSLDSRNVRLTYAKMAASQGGLFLERGYPAEAEEAFRLATEISPTSPEAVFRYANLLVEQGRTADALPVVQAAANAAPEDQQFRDLAAELNRMKTK